jgi:hypothetical protein
MNDDKFGQANPLPPEPAEEQAAAAPAVDPWRQAIEVPRSDEKLKRAATSHALVHLAQALGLDRDGLRVEVSRVVGREIQGAKDLTAEECDRVLYVMRGNWNVVRYSDPEYASRFRIITAIETEAKTIDLDPLLLARTKFGRPDLTNLADLSHRERLEVLWDVRRAIKDHETGKRK